MWPIYSWLCGTPLEHDQRTKDDTLSLLQQLAAVGGFSQRLLDLCAGCWLPFVCRCPQLLWVDEGSGPVLSQGCCFDSSPTHPLLFIISSPTLQWPTHPLFFTISSPTLQWPLSFLNRGGKGDVHFVGAHSTDAFSAPWPVVFVLTSYS